MEDEKRILAEEVKRGLTKEFLLTEYAQLAAAHFADGQRETNLFQYYIALITAPLSLIAAAISFRGGTILSLPSEVLDTIAIVLMIVAICGFLMLDIITDIRFEAILYARSINLVRRWFEANNIELKDYRVLPITDWIPRFFERDRIMGEVGLAGLLDSMLLGFGLWFLTQGLEFPILVGVGYFSIHVIEYALRARNRERRFSPKYEAKGRRRFDDSGVLIAYKTECAKCGKEILSGEEVKKGILWKRTCHGKCPV